MTLDGNNVFWRSDAVHVAMPPHLKDDDGLAKWAGSQLETSALIFFQTSGSEGKPKWVGISRKAFLASAEMVNHHLLATKHARWLIALPLYHVGGFSILARCHAVGASFDLYTQPWSAADFTACCEAHGTTLTSLVPTQVFDLVETGMRAPSSLRAIVVGGGALSKPLGTRARELGWPVLQSYGMTETCSQVATEPLDHLSQAFDPDRLEVLSQWNLSVGDDERLVVNGPALAAGYAFKEEGEWKWEPLQSQAGIITRDRVELWKEGLRRFLRFLGRESSFVKVKGELVSLLTVQQKIDEQAHRAGVQAKLVVCALPDERRDVRLVLVAEKGAITEDALLEIATKHGLSCPACERITDTKLVAEIPLSGPGKINMSALRLMLEADLSPQ